MSPMDPLCGGLRTFIGSCHYVLRLAASPGHQPWPRQHRRHASGRMPEHTTRLCQCAILKPLTLLAHWKGGRASSRALTSSPFPRISRLSGTRSRGMNLGSRGRSPPADSERPDHLDLAGVESLPGASGGRSKATPYNNPLSLRFASSGARPLARPLH